ncbi:nucleoside deaminase [Roseibacillus persicicus]|uniref:tRNA-specific adenosine deaminase n=1 Tax=Roseibacillus persicicus TaxID=454148 RepID=A0A918TT48_9BACT|nr:nucleoside deaminase [Roseibacillus persicicus]GHC60782.1 tRNA-specific adenosine deaminase [Roseibacillus persicicus]
MKIEISLPSWLLADVAALDEEQSWAAGEERMAWVLSLARRNIEEESGGPFAAAVFEKESGRLVAAGVNRVIPAYTSIAHAETVALALAQQKLKTHDLAAAGLPAMELVASAQPCIQCFGNTWWSGVKGLVIGARADDVESIVGFHEGPLPDGWPDLLENRPEPLPNVSVTRDLLREEARAVLALYRDSGGMVYNAGGE